MKTTSLRLSAEQRRAAIIHAVRRVFAEKGFHGTTTRELARAAGVSTALLYAMMRRESAFQPDRLSGARARGLMQLMARTATAIAKELQRENPEPDELYRPELNLDLSAWRTLSTAE